MNEVHEVSTNFDLDDVRPFLELVAAEVGHPLSIELVAELVNEIAALPVDSELVRAFEFQTEAGSQVLRLEVFMDDLESPDLYFFAPEALAARVQGVLDQWHNERGETFINISDLQRPAG